MITSLDLPKLRHTNGLTRRSVTVNFGITCSDVHKLRHTNGLTRRSVTVNSGITCSDVPKTWRPQNGLTRRSVTVNFGITCSDVPKLSYNWPDPKKCHRELWDHTSVINVLELRDTFPSAAAGVLHCDVLVIPPACWASVICLKTLASIDFLRPLLLCVFSWLCCCLT